MSDRCCKLLSLIQSLALWVLTASILFWLWSGAFTGWTRTQQASMEIDPITQIEFPVYQSVFIPGIDYLLAVSLPAFVVTVILVTVSQFKNTKNHA
jgi:hypothetical protein